MTLRDRPGALGRLATLLGEQGANILHLFHDRLAPELPLDYTRVELNLETRDWQHGEVVLRALRDAGYQVEEKPQIKLTAGRSQLAAYNEKKTGDRKLPL